MLKDDVRQRGGEGVVRILQEHGGDVERPGSAQTLEPGRRLEAGIVQHEHAGVGFPEVVPPRALSVVRARSASHVEPVLQGVEHVAVQLVLFGVVVAHAAHEHARRPAFCRTLDPAVGTSARGDGLHLRLLLVRGVGDGDHRDRDGPTRRVGPGWARRPRSRAVVVQ